METSYAMRYGTYDWDSSDGLALRRGDAGTRGRGEEGGERIAESVARSLLPPGTARFPQLCTLTSPYLSPLFPLLLFLLLFARPVLAQRVQYTINDGWRYAPETEPGAAPGFDDGAWERVDLPHTWNASDAFDKATDYRRGIGWYRKHLVLDPSLAGKRLFVYFEGANQVAEVFLNGRALGRHVGGYTAFVFEITDDVTFDEPNILAVRVDNRHDDDIPPLDADFTFYGGIYRDVWLLATAPVHLDVLDHASPGVFVDTPTVSEAAATVRVRGTVVNQKARPVTLSVVSRVLDPDRRAVAELRTAVDVAADGRAAFEQLSDPLANPRLWSPASPALYRVVTEVYDGDARVDAVDSPLGIRWLAVNANDGLLLNGRPLRLAGTNRHQDGPGYGNALPNAAHRRDVGLVRATGFNFLRLAHYPQDPVVLEEADRVGLGVWEEIPVVNTITMSDAFADHAEQMLVEMIRQHYNHPSVLIWGYMNEILLREPNPRPEGYRAAVLALARRLEARVKAEDPARLTATAVSYGEIDNGSGIQDVPDILGMNLYFGWYYETFEALGPFLDGLHARHPDRPLFISEYGAGSDERVHTTAPVRFDFSSELAQDYHRANFGVIEARPYLVGSAVWSQFDFGSAHRQDTKNAVNQKGLYFFDRTPKDVAWYYRARLLDAPVLHIAREERHRAGSRPEDRAQPVWAYANTDSVALFVNGEPQGTRPVRNARADWTVALRPGVNRVEARVVWNGRPVTDATEWVYDDRQTFFTDPGAKAALVAVNAGAHYAYIDAFGTVWEADRAYEAGTWGYEGGTPLRTHHRMLGTPDDPLFQAAREGAVAYRFDVPDGAYVVEVGFVETVHETAGARVFNVFVNDTPLVTDLDLTATAGRWVTTTRAVSVDAHDGTGIRISFTAGAGAPVVSSLLVRRR